MAWPSFVRLVNGFPVIDIGALRHTITIQKQGLASPPTFDSAGPEVSWNDFTTSNAAIRAIRGTDVIRGGQDTTQLYLEIAMRCPDDPGVPVSILSNMRVVNENASIYVIQSVENVLEMNMVLILNCVALGPNQ